MDKYLIYFSLVGKQIDLISFSSAIGLNKEGKIEPDKEAGQIISHIQYYSLGNKGKCDKKAEIVI